MGHFISLSDMTPNGLKYSGATLIQNLLLIDILFHDNQGYLLFPDEKLRRVIYLSFNKEIFYPVKIPVVKGLPHLWEKFCIQSQTF